MRIASFLLILAVLPAAAKAQAPSHPDRPSMIRSGMYVWVRDGRQLQLCSGEDCTTTEVDTDGPQVRMAPGSRASLWITDGQQVWACRGRGRRHRLRCVARTLRADNESRSDLVRMAVSGRTAFISDGARIWRCHRARPTCDEVELEGQAPPERLEITADQRTVHIVRNSEESWQCRVSGPSLRCRPVE